MASESFLELYVDILQTLERLNIPYVVIGAFAGMSYGMTRLTADVDIVVELNEEQVEALAAAYPPPRFYADPHQMQESIRLGIMFNIVVCSPGGCDRGQADGIWREGRFFKHEQDIRDILVAVRLNEEPEWTAHFDFEYVDRWAERLGSDVAALWQDLKAAAGVG
ncbi:hypothetical protein [Thermoflexus sp.]|uniref:hypothetical protein n=1 Tax=Thermoflexus sp. TaxID=1969742 RepID=UPI0035E44361